jgi:hypothetical protein
LASVSDEGILRLEGVGSSPHKTEVGNRLAYHEERQSLLFEVASIHADADLEHPTDDEDTRCEKRTRTCGVARRLAKEIDDLGKGLPGSTMMREERAVMMAEKVEQLIAIEERVDARAAARLAAIHGVGGSGATF